MDISLKKFGGYSLIIGAVVSTLVFIMQVVLGSPPEPGTNFLIAMSDTAVAQGSTTVLYALSSIIGIVLMIFGIYTFYDSLDESQKKHPFLRFGTFVLVISFLMFIMTIPNDLSMIFGAKENAKNIMSIEFGVIMAGGIILLPV